MNKKTVLLLEDKNEIAWLVSDILSDNYDVCCVHTSQEAFGYLRKILRLYFWRIL